MLWDCQIETKSPLHINIELDRSRLCTSSQNFMYNDLWKVLFDWILQDMLIAGFDATATAIEWTVAELVQHPQCMKKLQGEWDTMVGTDQVVSETDLFNLPYLQAVVKESSLMVPTVALEVCPPTRNSLSTATPFKGIPSNGPMPWNSSPSNLLRSANWSQRQPLPVAPLQCGHKDVPGNVFKHSCCLDRRGEARPRIQFALPHGKDPRNLDMTERFGTIMARVNILLVIPKPRLPSNLYWRRSSCCTVQFVATFKWLNRCGLTSDRVKDFFRKPRFRKRKLMDEIQCLHSPGFVHFTTCFP